MYIRLTAALAVFGSLFIQSAAASDNQVLITYEIQSRSDTPLPHIAEVKKSAVLYEEKIALIQARQPIKTALESEIISFPAGTEFVVLRNETLTRLCRKTKQANVIFGRPKADTYCLDDQDKDGLFERVAHFKSDQRFATDATFHDLKAPVELGPINLDSGNWKTDFIVGNTAGKRVVVKKIKKNKFTIDLEIGTVKASRPPNDGDVVKYRSYKQKKTFKETDLPVTYEFAGAQIEILKDSDGAIKSKTTKGFDPFVSLNPDGTHTVHGRTGGFHIATY